MSFFKIGREIHKLEKSRKENLMEKIQRRLLTGKEALQQKEKVLSNLHASLVNEKKSLHILFAIQRVHSRISHLWPSIDL